jgi:hypothetical protein
MTCTIGSTAAQKRAPASQVFRNISSGAEELAAATPAETVSIPATNHPRARFDDAVLIS